MATIERIHEEPFLWGAATAAHQVEGNNRNSDWWRAEQDGRVPHASADACDSWNHWPEDLRLLKELGLNAYRLSVEWARIEPEPGGFDHAALDHYRQQIVGLRAAGIEPVVTLHHFTNPMWLAEMGGWTNPAVVSKFAAYAAEVSRALGDLVTWWVSINEPNALGVRGYVRGDWPPFHRGDVRGYMRHLRHTGQGHIAAREAVRRHSPRAQVGVAFACWPLTPARRWHPLDRAAAPVYEWLWHGRLLSRSVETLDWLGVNYYSRLRTRWNSSARTMLRDARSRGAEVTDSGWEIYPQGLLDVLSGVARYGKPIMISENGIADARDDRRAAFTVDHVRQVARAIESGIDIRGYLHWSLLDNFEWSEGYSQRFGLAHVDFSSPDKTRTLRPSARVYARIARDGSTPHRLAVAC